MSNHIEDSFRKGEEFELFVQNRIFNKDSYNLIHKTPSYSQNTGRFIENTLKPDFQFRCIKTGQEFYVEAKFRTRLETYGNELLKPQHYDRFLDIEARENTQVYIIIGYGGIAQNPDKISFLPLNAFSEGNPGKKKIETYNIEKEPLDPSRISPAHKETPLNTIPGSETGGVFKGISNNRARAAIVLLAVIILSVFAWRYFSRISEEDLKERVTNYYKFLEEGNFDNLDKFIRPKVDRWFDNFNIDIASIEDFNISYRKKYPDAKAEVRWDTFKWRKDEQGNFHLEYELIYKLRRNHTQSYKPYHLKIYAIWDDDLMLSSMYEDILD